MKMSNKDKHYIMQAMNLAKMSECTKRTRHGCIIVKSGNPIAVGINCIRNDPKQFAFSFADTSGISVHAEEACLKAISNRAEGCTAYVVRVKSDDSMTMSRPCRRCMSKLKAAGVDKIYYSNYEGSVSMERI